MNDISINIERYLQLRNLDRTDNDYLQLGNLDNRLMTADDRHELHKYDIALLSQIRFNHREIHLKLILAQSCLHGQ